MAGNYPRMRTGIACYKRRRRKWLKKHVPDAVWQRKNGRAGMGEGSIRVGRPSVAMVVQTTLDAPAAERTRSGEDSRVWESLGDLEIALGITELTKTKGAVLWLGTAGKRRRR